MSFTVKSRLLLQRHGFALLLAFAVGALCILPQLYFMHSPEYRGVEMLGADAEDHYVARINEVYNGYPTLGNTFLAQKDVPPLLPSLGENIVARLGQALGLSAPKITIVAKFIFPFFAALLLYVLGYVLFRCKAAALLGTAAALLGDNLVSGLSAWKALARGSSDVSGFLTYARPINPEISGLFLFGGLLLIFNGFFRKKSFTVFEMAALGAIAGLSFYISPYISSFLFTVTSLSIAWFLYQRQYRLVLSGVASIAIGIVALVPYGVNYAHLIHSPLYAEAALRQGIIFSHAPVVSAWAFLLLAAALFLWPKRFALARPFFMISALALLLLLNQQILTGRTLQPSHYHWYITKPLVLIMLGMYAVAIAEYLFMARRTRIALYALGLVFLLYNALVLQIHSYRATLQEALAAQAYAPILAYLNTQPGGQIVWTDQNLSAYVPMYTQDGAANSPQILNYLVPTSFFEHQLFLGYRLQGLKPVDARAYMEAHPFEVSSTIWGVRFREQAGDYKAIPQSLVDAYAQDYGAYYAQSLHADFVDLGITMIIWDRNAEPAWNVMSVPRVQEAYASGNLSLYRIK